jgi:hypothetical protein
MIQNTRLAKICYWLAGELSRVKTWQQTYTWENCDKFFEHDPETDGPELPELDMKKAGRLWLPCRLSMRLLGLSEDLDYKHWEHWALEHSLCDEGLPCHDCGGHVDPPCLELV